MGVLRQRSWDEFFGTRAFPSPGMEQLSWCHCWVTTVHGSHKLQPLSPLWFICLWSPCLALHSSHSWGAPVSPTPLSVSPPHPQHSGFLCIPDRVFSLPISLGGTEEREIHRSEKLERKPPKCFLPSNLSCSWIAFSHPCSSPWGARPETPVCHRAGRAGDTSLTHLAITSALGLQVLP